MNKIEFSDVNRFLTSLGLIFIGLAFFLPWFINQNQATLIIEAEKLKKLTPTAQVVIKEQQDTILLINNAIPYLSVGLIILGVLLLVIGIVRWNKRQVITDKIQDEELKTKEIQNLSSQDKRDIIAEEIDSENANSGGDEQLEENIINDNINKYLNIENQIYLQLESAYNSRFALTPDVKIGDHNYDLIMKSKDTSADNDRIVEFKFYSNTLILENIKDASTQLVMSSKNYELTFKRRTLLFLIVVYSQNEYDLNLREYKLKIQEYTKTLGKIVRVTFVKESDIMTMKPTDYLKLS
jgi:uncharacterized membrane protein YidH (DUF202 family)